MDKKEYKTVTRSRRLSIEQVNQSKTGKRKYFYAAGSKQWEFAATGNCGDKQYQQIQKRIEQAMDRVLIKSCS